MGFETLKIAPNTMHTPRAYRVVLEHLSDLFYALR